MNVLNQTMSDIHEFSNNFSLCVLGKEESMHLGQMLLIMSAWNGFLTNWKALFWGPTEVEAIHIQKGMDNKESEGM